MQKRARQGEGSQKSSVYPSDMDMTHALYYLAATECYGKEVRSEARIEEERELLRKLTVPDLHKTLGSFENPSMKLKLLMEGCHWDTVRHMAKMWTDTHPDTPKPDEELK